ncbi:MAG: hypothetical protein M1816_008071 [Peltula sp. TS41687]|nr:MAG: hypothetical protein M1816_008071 [Peltula sp. TS41687]
MPSPILTTTIQSSLLAALSNILAQIVSSYQQQQQTQLSRTSTNPPTHNLSLSLTPILQFILFTILNCPPNILWQEFLEQRFPGVHKQDATPAATTTTAKEKPAQRQQPQKTGRLNVRNTLIKLLLDQTLGAALNTVAFIAIMAGLRGASSKAVADAVGKDFWPMMKAGWRVWPVVALVNFTVIPVHRRIVVGSLVGVGWGVYLSLMAGR